MPEESENRLTEDEVALNEQSKISFLDPSEFPRVEELQGQVSVYESKNNSFLPLQVGFEITEPTLFVVGEESELIISFLWTSCLSYGSKLKTGCLSTH